MLGVICFNFRLVFTVTVSFPLASLDQTVGDSVTITTIDLSGIRLECWALLRVPVRYVEVEDKI